MKSCISVTLIILFFSISCNSRITENERLYNEFMNIFQRSWILLQSENNKYPYRTINIGDTLKVSSDFSVMTKYNDSCIDSGFYFNLNPGSIIYILDTIGKFLEIKAENDSIGVLEYELILDEISNRKYFKSYKNNYEKINKERINQIEALLNKYRLSREEFYNVIAKEHYKKTGIPYIAY